MDSLKDNYSNGILNYNDSLNYCTSILPNVSRSFAIGIEFLSGELKKSVLVGYLLCRIIDTIEDDFNIDNKLKESYLINFIKCFSSENESVVYSHIGNILKGDEYHVDLVKNTDKVFHIYYSLSKNTQKILKNWISEMSKGMVLFINRYPKGIRISTLAEYQEYCYYVAGTVGHLLTELWKEYGFFISNKKYLIMKKNSAIFGETLQTINILKDIKWDAQNENSIYIPLELLKEQKICHESMLLYNSESKTINAIKIIFSLAHKNLKTSLIYLKSIPIINFRIRFFCIFPLLLALATLNKLERSENIINPEKTIKVSRSEVNKIKIYSIIASFSNFLLNKVINKIMKF